MSSEPETPTHVVHVCMSCRARGAPRTPVEQRAGFQLYTQLRAAVAESDLAEAVTVRPAQCLSVCPRPCGIALSSPGRWTYLFGDQNPDQTVGAIVACIEAYVESVDGFMSRGERPPALRASILGRIPCPPEASSCT